MKITLTVKSEDSQQVLKLEEGQSVVIGRSDEADFKLNDQKISSKHCRLHLKNDRLDIIDLESKNGTFLNTIRIDQSEFFLGDEIRIGKFLFTLDEKDLDAEAMEFLTFPGPFKDRIELELKIDFTGARQKNQDSEKPGKKASKASLEASQIREIEIRKKIKSRIKLSKQQIRSKHQFTAIMATLFDIAFLFVFLAIPLFLITTTGPDKLSRSQRSGMLFTVEVLVAAAYYMTNFKVSKFTLGEKFVGIENMYMKQ